MCGVRRAFALDLGGGRVSRHADAGGAEAALGAVALGEVRLDGMEVLPGKR